MMFRRQAAIRHPGGAGSLGPLISVESFRIKQRGRSLRISPLPLLIGGHVQVDIHAEAQIEELLLQLRHRELRAIFGQQSSRSLSHRGIQRCSGQSAGKFSSVHPARFLSKSCFRTPCGGSSIAKNAFGDDDGQHLAFEKSRERGFWQSISKDPVKSAPIRLGGTYRLLTVAVGLPFPRPVTMAEKAKLLQIQENRATAN
jgi:hypothetical protein